jgi:transitional endoplasmic reticulum ATPase
VISNRWLVNLTRKMVAGLKSDVLAQIHLRPPLAADVGHAIARVPSSLGVGNGELLILRSSAVVSCQRSFLCMALCVNTSNHSVRPRELEKSASSPPIVRADLSLSLPPSHFTSVGNGIQDNPVQYVDQVLRYRQSHAMDAVETVVVQPAEGTGVGADKLLRLAKGALLCLGRIPVRDEIEGKTPPPLALHGEDGAIVARIKADPPLSSVLSRSTRWVIEKVSDSERISDEMEIRTPGLQAPVYFGSPAYEAVRELLSQDFEALRRHGAKPMAGLLVSGPPGVGKTLGVLSAAKDCGYAIISSSVRKDGGEHGAPARSLRDAFGKARSFPKALIFLDELDGLCPRRSRIGGDTFQNAEMVRTVAQLLTLMDGGRKDDAATLVVGATNRPDAIDPALRRPGRFDREVLVQAPNECERFQFLAALEPSVDAGVLRMVSNSTPGFVAADLALLCADACKHAEGTRLDSSRLSSKDFIFALKRVRPSLLRGGLSTELARTSWDDIGGAKETKSRLQIAVEWPLKYPSTYKKLGLFAPRGLLLYGPPGCSKTTLVRAAATASGSNFLHLSGADVYSCYLGEAERILRSCFDAARAAAPSILFIDEIDAIVGKRDTVEKAEGNDVKDRVLSTLLTELDGITSSRGVVVIGATNRVDLLDDALLRPGRFDEIVHVGLPNAGERCEILRIHASRLPLASDTNVEDIAGALPEGCSGAEIAALCQEAGLLALREIGYNVAEGVHRNLQVRACHIMEAIYGVL